MRTATACCLGLVTAVGLPSQTTHLVGPSGLPTIDAALAVASPGDVVHVEPGSYPGFTATIGVTIRALGDVRVGDSVLQPGVGQPLHLVGLGTTDTGSFHVGGGHVTLEACWSWGHANTPSGPPPLRVSNATATLQACSFSSYFSSGNGHDVPGMVAQNANVTAVDSTFRTIGLYSLSPTARIDGGRFHASACRFEITAFPGGGGDGMETLAGAEVWVSDSTFVTPFGFCPIVDLGAGILRVERSVLPTTGSGCATSQPGPALLGSSLSGPIENGASFTLTMRGAPGTLVAVHASPGLATTALPGLFEQPLKLDLGAFWLAGVFVTDPTGVATATWNMPAGLYVDTAVWLEAITVEPTFPWQVAPVVGGVIR